MDAGDKFTLWQTKYKDGRNMVLREVEVEVAEVCDCKCAWSDQMYPKSGCRAIAKDGEEFTLHWKSAFPSDSMTPNYYWNKTDSLDEWCDAFQAANSSVICGYPMRDGERAVPAGGTICQKHGYVYRDECFYCKHNFPEKTKRTVEEWV